MAAGGGVGGEVGRGKVRGRVGIGVEAERALGGLRLLVVGIDKELLQLRFNRVEPSSEG